MTTATPPLPAGGETDAGGDFSTPERLREYAQQAFDTKLKNGVAELRPTVEVSSVPTGISVRLSVTGEGFLGETSEVRVYLPKRLASDPQVRSAIWLQYSRLLRKLKPVHLPLDEDE